MTEPEYHFVKGQGWVIKPSTQVFFVFTSDRKRLRVTAQNPILGKAYFYSRIKDSYWLNPDGSWNESHLEKHASHYRLSDWGCWKDHYKPLPDHVYAVLELVDD